MVVYLEVDWGEVEGPELKLHTRTAINTEGGREMRNESLSYNNHRIKQLFIYYEKVIYLPTLDAQSGGVEEA